VVVGAAVAGTKECKVISKRAKLLAIRSMFDVIESVTGFDCAARRFTLSSLVACGVTIEEFLEAKTFEVGDEELVILVKELLENAENLASQKLNN
jgi:hypothetical protein